MIFDIDSSNSVQTFVKAITEGWFDIDSLYAEIKAESFTNSPNFWNITENLMNVVSSHLNHEAQEFLNIFVQKCRTHNARIMGYHCTRHSDKNVFLKNGILPLSEEIIKFPKNQKTEKADRMLEYRLTRGPGPYFFLSYTNAKDPNNYFCQKGSEILMACNGQQQSDISSESIPLIIHCAIPFSILPDHTYYMFCILRAYFIFIDPEDDSENLFEGYSIDLKGKPLGPQYIVKIEEL